MKKRIIAVLLCLMMLVSVLPQAVFAGTRFTDVNDAVTALNTDILGLLGVVSDSSEKLFYPEESLTRAEFCKMAVIMAGQEGSAAKYKNSSIFPDVRASHWASGYIGAAARGEKKFIGGYPDGSFCPDDAINYGEAITIVMRLLGYSDSDSGAVWPQGYMDLATKLDAYVYGLKGTDNITRAQAAELFVDMLTAETKSGAQFCTSLGSSAGKKTISNIDGGSGLVRFSDTNTCVLKYPVMASSLIGKTGTVYIDAASEKMIMFIPDSIEKKDAPASAAVIVAKDGSQAGFEALSGGRDYFLYKNGIPAESSDIRRYDVATYNPKTNCIVLSDNCISAYYEDCSPSPSEPSQITILGGTKLDVLTTACDSLKSFKPGMTVSLLLTAEGKVAGAVSSASYANMLAAVDYEGKVSLICGSTLIPVKASQKAESKFFGKVVSIRSYRKDEYVLTAEKTSAQLALDVSKNTADGKLLSDNVMIFEDGVPVSKNDIKSAVPASRIVYYRLNHKNQISLISYSDNGEIETLAGKASKDWGEEYDVWDTPYEILKLKLEFAQGSEGIISEKTYEEIPEGSYVAADLKKKASGKLFQNIRELEKTGRVTKASFIGDEIVNCGGVSYEISEAAAFYNTDSKRWMDSFDEAFTYADEFTLYTSDGTVYLMEVSANVY